MGKNRKSELAQRLDGLSSVDEALFAALQTDLSVSESWLRRHLRESALALEPLVEGVRQDSVENLVRTLSALADLYPARGPQCRALVLEAKRHARFQRREETLLHLNVWLENPQVFPVWAKLRLGKAKRPYPGGHGLLSE